MATKQFLFLPYVYNVTPAAAIAANGTVNVPWLLDQDADFELHEIFARSSGDAVGDVRPNNYSFQIQDKTSGRNWSDSLIPQAAAARIGSLFVKRPVVIARRSNMTVVFTNLTGGGLTPTLSFIGAKIIVST